MALYIVMKIFDIIKHMEQMMLEQRLQRQRTSKAEVLKEHQSFQRIVTDSKSLNLFDHY